MNPSILRTAVEASGKVLAASDCYAGALLKDVLFKPDSISAPPSAANQLNFPWKATKASLNGFNSVHGGALSTLASTFTRIHAQALGVFPSSTPLSTSFDIRFLSAVSEGEVCQCLTSVSGTSHDSGLVSIQFSFVDGDSRVLANGSNLRLLRKKRDPSFGTFLQHLSIGSSR